jgi:hypothetical protein
VRALLWGDTAARVAQGMQTMQPAAAIAAESAAKSAGESA